jgi:hypothetical protein
MTQTLETMKILSTITKYAAENPFLQETAEKLWSFCHSLGSPRETRGDKDSYRTNCPLMLSLLILHP